MTKPMTRAECLDAGWKDMASLMKADPSISSEAGKQKLPNLRAEMFRHIKTAQRLRDAVRFGCGDRQATAVALHRAEGAAACAYYYGDDFWVTSGFDPSHQPKVQDIVARLPAAPPSIV